MKLRRLRRFTSAYLELSPEDRRRVDKALRFLAEDWRHPSLQVKRVRNLDNVWEARGSLSIRITFELQGDTIVLRNVGPHDKTIKDA